MKVKTIMLDKIVKGIDDSSIEAMRWKARLS
jgi:hypothetical protein